MCASEQDSGVEDEDLSPRPSPSPHLPAQQVSFLMDAGLVFSVASFADGSRTVALLVKSGENTSHEGTPICVEEIHT